VPSSCLRDSVTCLCGHGKPQTLVFFIGWVQHCGQSLSGYCSEGWAGLRGRCWIVACVLADEP
jgi:hypothetical protein